MISVISATYIDHVIKRPVLGDRPQNRLVICAGIDGRKTIGSGCKTPSNIRSKNTADSCRIKTFEEGERGWVGNGCRCQRIKFLHDDVRVTNYGTSTVNLTRSSVIVGCGVHKVTSDHVLNRHLDSKRLFSRDRATVSRELKFR